MKHFLECMFWDVLFVISFFSSNFPLLLYSLFKYYYSASFSLCAMLFFSTPLLDLRDFFHAKPFLFRWFFLNYQFSLVGLKLTELLNWCMFKSFAPATCLNLLLRLHGAPWYLEQKITPFIIWHPNNKIQVCNSSFSCLSSASKLKSFIFSHLIFGALAWSMGFFSYKTFSIQINWHSCCPNRQFQFKPFKMTLYASWVYLLSVILLSSMQVTIPASVHIITKPPNC